MRQIMCVRLNQWPIDRAIRRLRQDNLGSKSQIPKSLISKSLANPGILAAKPGPQNRGSHEQSSKFIVPNLISGEEPSGVNRDVSPLVLVRTVSARQLVVFASNAALVAGVSPGMTLAEARALCSGLIDAEYRPDRDLQALHALARWMVRFSPVVSVQSPDALFLDVTGSERLFTGLDRLLARASESLARMKLHHGIAIAPTPAAAFALALPLPNALHSRKNTGPVFAARIFTFEQLPAAIAPLAVSSLRLSEDLNQAFHALGVETIGQLMQLPRATLPARFGATVLNQLDQALGGASEPLIPIPHAQPVIARMEFEGGIEGLTDLLQAGKQLLQDILQQLRQRGCGARTLQIEFELPKPPLRYESVTGNKKPSSSKKPERELVKPDSRPIVKTINLSRPTADLPSLWNLLRCATETVKCGNDGFAALQLSVPVYERMTLEQLHLLDHESVLAEGEVDYLIERLRIRLGEGAVMFPRPVQSHLPEKAVSYVPLEKSEPSAVSKEKNRTSNEVQKKRSSLDLQSPVFDSQRSTFALIPSLHEAAPSPVPLKPRPLHLLPDPVEVNCTSLFSDIDTQRVISFTHAGEVFHLVHCNGPERITGSWWEGRNKTRDYFDVEDRAGQRFWLFQVGETRKWYLHGEC